MSSRLLSRSTLIRPELISRSIRPVQSVNAVRSYSTSPNPSSPNLRTTAFLSVALLTSAYLVYRYETSPTSPATEDGSLNAIYGEKFDIRIRGSRGVRSYEFNRKSEKEVERILKENESGEKDVGRKGNPVIRWDTNWVGSNEPCEDRFASNLIPRKSTSSNANDGSDIQSDEGKKDLLLFSIIDGHAGDATSRLLKETLNPVIAISLAGLQAGFLPPAESTGWKYWTEKLNPTSWFYSGKAESAWKPENVTKTLQYAFTQLDDHICQSPIRLLNEMRSASSANLVSSDKPTPRETLVALSQPATAGACAMTTLVDSENQDLYVALVGDCRAVAGWQTADGKWRCDALTEDQMGENLKEVERVRKEHPHSERDTVIKNGRVQGGLQPTRAMGDAVYKWPTEQGNAIAKAYKEENVKPRPVRPWNFTPPYVSAKPEVTYRKLTNDKGDKLKFVIMATDGLWDRLTSEESVLLLASYLSHSTHPDIPKTQLPKLFPLVQPTEERPYPVQELPQPTGASWAYEGDSNAATHLIRNSLAGANRKNMAELLSMTGEVTREMRDDVTCTVIFFDDANR
ncbi:uncharacterized protein IL334_000214 [Kwoniella shivajii]|uniref:PPM-type phosphatase domain-containing protein n=1 Tax=Kwoniella shivajii TaxID=564305 RepID=A0ABZ1CNI7_9TREE|nr:hypothetical protein IL334_000214 [Kwoniella shivajii]